VARWGVDRERISVIPNGIELPQNDSAAFTFPRNIDLIYAGRFVPTKNIEDLIEVIRICHAAGVIRRAVLVGDGPLLETMTERAKTAGLASVIEFAGRKSNAEVLELLLQSKIFIHASSREGFSVVMVEAMACELPVVAYHVPGVVDVIESGKTGVLVAERDTQAHAQACMELLTSSEHRTALASAGRITVFESLTLAKMADRVLSVYLATAPVSQSENSLL
jgi:glycosyltransferase involved in cell wall biosynthesis